MTMESPSIPQRHLPALLTRSTASLCGREQLVSARSCVALISSDPSGTLSELSHARARIVGDREFRLQLAHAEVGLDHVVRVSSLADGAERLLSQLLQQSPGMLGSLMVSGLSLEVGLRLASDAELGQLSCLLSLGHRRRAEQSLLSRPGHGCLKFARFERGGDHLFWAGEQVLAVLRQRGTSVRKLRLLPQSACRSLNAQA